MVELKTLNDFVTKPIYLDFDRKPTTKDSSNLAYCGGCGGDFLEVGCHCGSISSKDLKQEAIKQIKIFRENKNSTGFKATMAFDFKISDIEGTIGWMKYFFNITEEDLK